MGSIIEEIEDELVIVRLKKEVEIGDEPWVNYAARNTGKKE